MKGISEIMSITIEKTLTKNLCFENNQKKAC